MKPKAKIMAVILASVMVGIVISLKSGGLENVFLSSSDSPLAAGLVRVAGWMLPLVLLTAPGLYRWTMKTTVTPLLRSIDFQDLDQERHPAQSGVSVAGSH